ncbi:MAG TPA: hypothetical protein VFV95_19315 [Vicinamibacterales bacterium]|nr:hypothetical protein [Vicinamibacterales bacterium]
MTAASACGSAPQAATVPAAAVGTRPVPAEPAAPLVHVRFHNVHLRLGEGIAVDIRDLSGALVSTAPGKPPVFDDQRSFLLRVDAGTIAISPSSLSRILNERVFASKRSSIRNVSVSLADGRLVQKGTLRKGLRIPFTIVAELSAAPDGRIRIHPTSVKAAGIPASGLLKLLGLDISDLVKSDPSVGLEVSGNDLLLSAERLFSEPAIRGRLREIRIDGDRIVQTFGGNLPPGPAGVTGNYMQYRGGQLRFGKLTMSDADMMLIDVDPRDPFDFWPARYVQQLVAGYSKNDASGALRVYMPDYDQSARASLRPLAVLD